MKVLYDISYLSVGHRNLVARAGIFRVAETLAIGLKKSNECELFCVASESYDRLFDAFDYLKSNSELAEVPLIGTTDRSWQRRLNLHQAILEINRQVEESSGAKKNSYKVKRKFLIWANRYLKKSFKPIDPDLIQKLDIFHSPFDPIPEEINQSGHIKKFVTIYDLIPVLYPNFFPAQGGNQTVLKVLSKLNYDSWVFCISESTKNDLCNYSKVIDPQKVFVTHLAASNLFYSCNNRQKNIDVRAKYGIPDAPYILSLSTFEPRKNIDSVIKCFFNLIEQEKKSNLNLVLVGTKGWKYDKIFTEISSNPQLKNRVIITGYVDNMDLATLYSNATAFVYLSFYEGFGLPPLEAMQCGTPVITSNSSSLPEVVGDAGILLDPTDTDGLCHALLNIENHSSIRDSMSQKSLEQAKKFSWDKTVRETINGYKIALNS
ncbi:glycosyltransferase family 4 protein [Chamaesiphon minutus]|uniref:Glycosyltransferase n=1 Tax=Chamaesiphon minutus (strain ATCC 27169 / PCC 6605) TaxID=1173020 RepID=K9ULR2_CHAP6|nr:glycosyltransferase family 1 protein [Chamaesiphon minutus]AFY95603.1 glycosyltransferase [Chamaesiphon minutus PCC 6605]